MSPFRVPVAEGVAVDAARAEGLVAMVTGPVALNRPEMVGMGEDAAPRGVSDLAGS
jgi:hypothetical protein